MGKHTSGTAVDTEDYSDWWVIQVQTSPRKGQLILLKEEPEFRTQSCGLAPSSSSQDLAEAPEFKLAGSWVQASRRCTECHRLNKLSFRFIVRNQPELQWNRKCGLAVLGLINPESVCPCCLPVTAEISLEGEFFLYLIFVLFFLVVCFYMNVNMVYCFVDVLLLF